MKTISINITENGKEQDINNVYSFTHFNYQNNSGITCKSIDYNKEIEKIIGKKKYQKYSINLDWLQLVATRKVELNFTNYKTENITLTEDRCHNPNFLKCYVVNLHGNDVLELFAYPTNNSFKTNEVSIKVKNNFLYYNNFVETINFILNELNLEFKRVSRVDIAIDGADNLKITDYIKRYTKYDTIQINNENLLIEAVKFNKKDLCFETYSIGSKNYGKTAKVYNKSKEIQTSNKLYIKKFWEANNLDTNTDIGRFELQLTT